MKNFFKSVVVRGLTFEARCVLKKYHPRIIAVTGSVGKTSTKDAIFTAISGDVHARKSEKSFNSEIGVPLTILGLANAWSNPFLWFKNLLDGLLLIVFKQEYPEWLVLEVGADRPGDIESVAAWLKPDVAVFTRLPDVPVHVEFFSSPEEVIKEKKFLAYALKAGGTTQDQSR
jgi:UDP-N-acetylmuramoyl-tripeptide--D-alanyl-D-alanine ligase